MTRDTDADGRVLDANELDITADERVAELDDGRFVVSTDGPPNVTATSEDPDSSEAPKTVVSPTERPASTAAARERLVSELDDADATYAVELAGVVDGTPTTERVETDDVVDAFERVVAWYARTVGAGTPSADALGILLAEADVPVSLPPAALETLAEERGLDTSDSIGDLVDACRGDSQR